MTNKDISNSFLNIAGYVFYIVEFWRLINIESEYFSYICSNFVLCVSFSKIATLQMPAIQYVIMTQVINMLK